jgi:hypothetical protein
MLTASRLIALTTAMLAFVGCKPGEQVSSPQIDITSNSPKEVVVFEDLEYNNEPLIHHDDAGRVKVKVDSAWADDNLLILRAEFTPDDPGFHLYCAELPRSGINGVGRPTLLEVSNPEQFLEVGKLVSNKDSIQKMNQVLNFTYPVYPNGAVILYLPLRFKEVRYSEWSVPIKLTYMSCSDKTCNVPIESAEETINIPIPHQN